MKNKLALLLVVIAVCATQSAIAQNCEWAKSAGGSGDDIATSVTTDAFGNVYVTGYFKSLTITYGTITLTNLGVSNIFLTKYDSLGNVIWAKSAGGIGNDYANSVTTDTYGNVYITGGYSSPNLNFGTTTLTNYLGEEHTFLAKYDSHGNAIWAKNSSGNNSDRAFSSTNDAFGNVYITGYYTGTSITFGTISLNSMDSFGNCDIFIVKYDYMGNVIWAKGAGGSGKDVASAVSTDASGNVYITGRFNSTTITFGTIMLTNVENLGSNDIFIAKYDSIGNVIWAKGVGGANNDMASSVSTDAAGNIYITGYYFSPSITFGTTILTNAGVSDIFLTKYDTLGNVVWAKSAGGGYEDNSNSVTTDVSGNIYITGYYTSTSINFGTITLMRVGDADMFLTKYDSFGNVVWAKNSIDLFSGISSSVAADVSGNVYITGNYDSKTIIFDTTTLNNDGNILSNDIFLVKYKSGNTNITSIHQETTNFALYPNPTNNNLTLICNTSTNIATITIVDVLGRQVYTQTDLLVGNIAANNKTYNVALPVLPDGVYYLHVNCGNSNECLQFVVSNTK